MRTPKAGTSRRHESRLATNDKLVAADVMARHVVAVSPETPIQDATRRMLDLAVPGVPVVDGGHALVGVLGEHDLMARLAPVGTDHGALSSIPTLLLRQLRHGSERRLNRPLLPS